MVDGLEHIFAPKKVEFDTRVKYKSFVFHNNNIDYLQAWSNDLISRS